MRGQFAVENSQYPVAALPSGEGKYYITNMIELDRLSEQAFSKVDALRMAAQINNLHRLSRQQGWRGHGLSPEVRTAAVAAIENIYRQPPVL